MASHLDLEEQEQLAQIKHFWAKHGNRISWLLIAVLLGLAAWNGWQYWQRKSALEAAALYDELEQAVWAQDKDKVRRVWSDMQSAVPRTLQAQHAALLVAKAMHSEAAEESRAALRFVVDKNSDPGLVAVARLRLAALDLAAQQHEAALKWLDAELPAAFAPMVADRRGDILLAQNQRDAAQKAYLQAWKGLEQEPEYRRIVEAKLNALGMDPSAPPAP